MSLSVGGLRAESDLPARLALALWVIVGAIAVPSHFHNLVRLLSQSCTATLQHVEPSWEFERFVFGVFLCLHVCRLCVECGHGANAVNELSASTPQPFHGVEPK
eukprot:2787620-Amphidinium_carterae.1